MVPGRTVNLGDKEYTVPSLTARSVVTLDKAGVFAELAKPDLSGGARLEKSCTVLAAAMGRNYPDLTADKLLDFEPAELYAALATAMEVTSGGRKPPEGETRSPPTS